MKKLKEKEVTFYLKNPKNAKGQIIMQLNFGYKEIDFKTKKEVHVPLKYATGLSVAPAFWDKDNKKVLAGYSGYKSINAEMNNLENLLLQIYETLQFQNKDITPSILKEQLNIQTGKKEETRINSFIVEFVDHYIEEAKKHPEQFSKGTITSYNNFKNKLEEFEKAQKIRLTFENLTGEILSDFFNFLNNYTVDKEGTTMSKNTIWKFKKNMRKFLNQAVEEKIKINFNYRDKKYSAQEEEVDHIYLDFDEIDQLLNVDLSKSPYLDRVRDLWVMDAYLGGLRYSDLGRNLEPKKLKMKNGNTIEFVELRTIKTGELVQIPIFKPVKKIYEKYQGNFPAPITNQKFNQYIKKVAEKAELKEKTDIARTRKGEMAVKTLKKWELVTAHTARRSFATNFYLLGVPAQTLMKITGHTTERAFMKYIKAGLKDHLQLFYNIAAPKLDEIEKEQKLEKQKKKLKELEAAN